MLTPKQYAERIAAFRARQRSFGIFRGAARYDLTNLSVPVVLLEQRNYFDYDGFFTYGLRRFFGREIDLFGFLRETSRREGFKGPLRVLDDGAGEGKFCSYLTDLLANHGLKAETTALSLNENPYLREKLKEGKISEIVVGEAENFIPKKKYHLITSLCGSMGYLDDPEIARDYLLQFASSLEKGGLLLIGFSAKHLAPSRFGSGKKISAADKSAAILRALRKQGLKAELYEYPPKLINIGPEYRRPPSRMLVIQRI